MTPTVFKLTAVAAAVVFQLLVACGGGGSGDSTPTATPVTVRVAPTTEPAQDAASAFLAKVDALIATAIPTTGATFTVNDDGWKTVNGQLGKTPIAI